LFEKKSDEKERADQACEDQEQMFVATLSANDHTNWTINFGATQHTNLSENCLPFMKNVHG
jgi:hypothetical protein